MNAFYVIWMIVISAVDGHTIEERAVSKPMTFEQCHTETVGRASRAEDGKVSTYWCRKAEGTSA